MLAPQAWRRFAAGGSIVAALIIAACADSVEPRHRRVTYDLALVDGQTLPAVYLVYGFGATKRVISGSLDLTSESQLIDIKHTTNTPFGANPTIEDFHDTTTFRYRLEGDKLIIHRTNPSAPVPAYSDTGLVDGGVLYLNVATIDGTPNQRRVLTYVERQ